MRKLFVILLILLFVVRPYMMRKRRKAKEAVTIGEVQDVYLKEGEAEALEGRKEAPSLRPMQDKALVSTIIKEWVREGR